MQAAVLAAQQASRQWGELRAALERDMQAAQYEARRARKQYDAVDPENRLVADELKRRWNQALLRVRDLEQRLAAQPGVEDTDRAMKADEWQELANDLETIWIGAGTDVRLRFGGPRKKTSSGRRSGGPARISRRQGASSSDKTTSKSPRGNSSSRQR